MCGREREMMGVVVAEMNCFWGGKQQKLDPSLCEVFRALKLHTVGRSTGCSVEKEFWRLTQLINW